MVDDAQSLATFADDACDFIVAHHVLEHLEDPIEALTNFSRVTRRGGTIFLTLPDARHSFDYLRERTTVEHLLRDHHDGPSSSRQEHYAEWATFIEGIGPEGIATRAAEYAADHAHHHFHVELPTFLAFLSSIDLELDVIHAQMNGVEFAVILRNA